MSITDLRAYADTAVEQGKQAGKQAIGLAQAQFDGVAGELAGTARSLHLDSYATTLRNLVEPYLDQARQVRGAVTGRAEKAVSDAIDTVVSDKRVARVLATAEDVTGTVVGTVQSVAGPVLAPVVGLAERGRTLVRQPFTRSSGTRTRSTATTTSKPATAKKSTAKAASKPAAKKTTRSSATPRKTATTRSTSSTATAKKSSGTTKRAPRSTSSN